MTAGTPEVRRLFADAVADGRLDGVAFLPAEGLGFAVRCFRNVPGSTTGGHGYVDVTIDYFEVQADRFAGASSVSRKLESAVRILGEGTGRHAQVIDA